MLWKKLVSLDLRSTCATRLYTQGVDEQAISEVTGHTSNAVREYKRTDINMQKRISAILQQSPCSENKIEIQTEKQPMAESSSIKDEENMLLNENPTPKRIKLDFGDLHFDVTF